MYIPTLYILRTFLSSTVYIYMLIVTCVNTHNNHNHYLHKLYIYFSVLERKVYCNDMRYVHISLSGI